MDARASFSNDSRLVKMALPKSLLLKDYLLDDLSSCSSNGFKSYPRRQCFTPVRYLIEIDLNKHMKLPTTQKQFLKSKSKPKLKSKSKSKSKSKTVSVLHKASAAVVNVFKNFQFSRSGKNRKPCFLPRNLSRKLSKRGFWKKSNNRQNKHFERLKSFDDSITEKEKNSLPPSSKVSIAVTTTTTTSNSNSSASSESYFTFTSDSSTTGGSSKINVAQNDVEESEQQVTVKKKKKKKNVKAKKSGGATVTATGDSAADGNAKKRLQNEEKEQISPVSVMDFPCDDEDEVTSPYQHSRFHVKGRKQKLMPKVRKSKSVAELEPIRLEDRIALSESRTQDSTLETSLQSGLELGQEENQIEKKAVAMLQLLKATMPSHGLFESTMTDNVLLAFFIEQINKGSVTNLAILQEAKDWMNGDGREMLESQNYKITYITDTEKGVNWLKYDDEEVSLQLEYEVFTSLVDEMLLEFHF